MNKFYVDALVAVVSALSVVVSAMIMGGVFKHNALFQPVFDYLYSRIQSKRLVLLLVSLVSGVLPVEGRVTISAPVLDSLLSSSCQKRGHKGRGKMGILDYVATHHYYLWSPLEKSVVLVRAGLGLTYLEFLAVTAVPLLVYLGFLVLLVFFYVDEKDIHIDAEYEDEYLDCGNRAARNLLPFAFGVGLSIVTDAPQWVFPAVALLYVYRTSTGFKEALSYINLKVVGFVVAVILVSCYVRLIDKQMLAVLLHSGAESTAVTASLILAGSFITSYMLGSSSKYAATTVIFVSVLGPLYLPVVLMFEFAGYLLSPTHKCCAISASYFGTSVREFQVIIGGLAALMMATGAAVSLFLTYWRA